MFLMMTPKKFDLYKVYEVPAMPKIGTSILDGVKEVPGASTLQYSIQNVAYDPSTDTAHCTVQIPNSVKEADLKKLGWVERLNFENGNWGKPVVLVRKEEAPAPPAVETPEVKPEVAKAEAVKPPVSPPARKPIQ